MTKGFMNVSQGNQGNRNGEKAYGKRAVNNTGFATAKLRTEKPEGGHHEYDRPANEIRN